MGVKRLLQPLTLLYFLFGGATASVYSCEELQNRMINMTFTQTTRFACVVAQEDFSNWDQLKKIRAQTSQVSTSFADIANSTTGCVENSAGLSWKIVADADISKSCGQEFTLILTSNKPTFVKPLHQENAYNLKGKDSVLVVPNAGMWLHKQACTGNGIVTLSTGAGNGQTEDLYSLHSWTCQTLPDWIFTFDNVVTINADDDVSYAMTCSDLRSRSYSTMNVSPDENIVVLTSGRSDNIQNLNGKDLRAYIQIGNSSNWVTTTVNANMQLFFDSSNTGDVDLQKTFAGQLVPYKNGTYNVQFDTSYFEVRWMPKTLQASEISSNQDNIYVEIFFGKPGSTATAMPTTTRTTTPQTTSLPTPAAKVGYCDCTVDKFGFSTGWSSNGIWLDIVVILDTSEAMGADALDAAAGIVESFIFDGESDVLVTDSAANFYTRVGVISMSDTANVLYNLNLTKADRVLGKALIKKGVLSINVVDAFDAALNMFNDGLKSAPERADTRQVIYYMTDSDPKNNLNPLNEFKASQGVIIVNNFLEEGEVELPGLKELASDGYYYSDNNYLLGIQAFCKANCYCKSDKDALGGADPAIKAAGGCYHPTPAAVPYSKATSTCKSEGGILAVVHDEKKGDFLHELMAKTAPKSDYFWIGFSKSDDGVWRWEDQSTDTYTNWGVGEPSPAAVSKCTYVDQTTPALMWGAANCQAGFPYTCEYVPCSVGNKC